MPVYFGFPDHRERYVPFHGERPVSEINAEIELRELVARDKALALRVHKYIVDNKDDPALCARLVLAAVKDGRLNKRAR